MAVNRAELIDQNFRGLVASLLPSPARDDLDAPVRAGSSLSARLALELFESMLGSRHLDYAAREMRARNEGFYTIGSTGHEGNAAVAAALRPTDMAFLHYRSGAFFVQRGRQVPGATPLMDVLLGLASSSDEPIAGGRHKVFGSKPLWIPPQTSTIASHLPKAVGTAFALGRAARLGLPTPIPKDSVVVCTFGDASSNHATACTAFNAAALASFQNLPCPVLFVCEDNGIGISVRTPDDWVHARFSAHAGLRYFQADGLDLPDAWDNASAAVDWVRLHRRPAFLHLRTVRLLGHAGSDVEMTYRPTDEIAALEAQDPLLSTARLLVGEGWLSPEEALGLYDEIRERVAALAAEAGRRPRLRSAVDVMRPLAPLDPAAVAAEVARPVDEAARRSFHGRLPEEEGPRHLAVNINRALGDLLLKYPETFLFGEDVGKKGGVYNVTAGLQAKTGVARVFNTALDETSILGLGMGFGHLGLIALPEIQYLAYVHNAIDQLRGEACSLQYFSQDQFQNPMVVRIASLAYQKGFGGHFHNDNALSALREIPALLMAAPSNGEDAAGMLRTLVAAARVNGRVSTFHEPIALYMTRDLYEPGDNRWAFPYPDLDHHVPVGKARTWTEHAGPDGEADLTIVSYGNGLWMSLRVARKLKAELGIRARVVDLRWLKPLPLDDLEDEVRRTGRLLMVDECRERGGPGDEVIARLVERVPGLRSRQVLGLDCYIPLGDAANLVLVQEPDIAAAARDLMERP